MGCNDSGWFPDDVVGGRAGERIMAVRVRYRDFFNVSI